MGKRKAKTKEKCCLFFMFLTKSVYVCEYAWGVLPMLGTATNKKQLLVKYQIDSNLMKSLHIS